VGKRHFITIFCEICSNTTRVKKIRTLQGGGRNKAGYHDSDYRSIRAAFRQVEGNAIPDENRGKDDYSSQVVQPDRRRNQKFGNPPWGHVTFVRLVVGCLAVWGCRHGSVRAASETIILILYTGHSSTFNVEGAWLDDS
jgi:hypothetical protein